MIITDEFPVSQAAFIWSAAQQPLQGYTIKRGLGIGSFGEVYLADTAAGKQVALKRITRNADVEVRGTRHCLNLRHPNLVELYDVRQIDDQTAWIVMQFVAGQSLRELLDGEESISLQRKLDIFAQIASAVEYLHSQGIVHRDLKPSNVFLDGDFVKLGDYGLTKYISASKRADHTDSVGTLAYMAPEISRGQYGHQVDIYALGVMLYEMLSDRLPFEANSPQEMIFKHMTDIPDVAHLARVHQVVILKAMEKDAARRYSEVAEMLAALELSSVSDKQPVKSVQSKSSLHQATSAYKSLKSKAKIKNSIALAIDEPLAVTVLNTSRDLFNWWKALPSQSVRSTLLIATTIGFFITAGFWAAIAFWLAMFYPTYFCIRYWLRKKSRVAQALQSTSIELAGNPSSIKQLNSSAVSNAFTQQSLTFRQWQIAQRHRLALRPAAARWREWSGSAVAASICVGVLAIIGGLILLASNLLTPSLIVPLITWTAATVWLAAIAILWLSKFWEIRSEDRFAFRFAQLSVGLGVAVASFCLDRFLAVPWDQAYAAFNLPIGLEPGKIPTAVAFHLKNNEKVIENFFAGGRPLLPAYLSFFALLLGGIRWWRLSDRVRRYRMSYVSVILAIGVTAFFVNLIYFPMPWALMVAGSLAVVLQFSSYWSDRSMSCE